MMSTCDHGNLSEVPEVTAMAPIEPPSEGEARIILDGDTDDEEVPRLSRIHCEAASLPRAEATPLLNNTYSQLGPDGNMRRRRGRRCGNTFCGFDFDRMKPMSKDDIDPLGLFLSIVTALAFGFCGYITYLYFIENSAQNTAYTTNIPYPGEQPIDGSASSGLNTEDEAVHEAVHPASAAASAAIGAGHHALRHALRRR